MPKGAPEYSFDVCLVCNDKAKGFHYGLKTCNGCKGFFKRTISKTRKYTCYLGKECVLTEKARNCCKACRFEKCLKLGMSIDGIRKGRIPKAHKEQVLSAALMITIPEELGKNNRSISTLINESVELSTHDSGVVDGGSAKSLSVIASTVPSPNSDTDGKSCNNMSLPSTSLNCSNEEMPVSSGMSNIAAQLLGFQWGHYSTDMIKHIIAQALKCQNGESLVHMSVLRTQEKADLSGDTDIRWQLKTRNTYANSSTACSVIADVIKASRTVKVRTALQLSGQTDVMSPFPCKSAFSSEDSPHDRRATENTASAQLSIDIDTSVLNGRNLASKSPSMWYANSSIADMFNDLPDPEQSTDRIQHSIINDTMSVVHQLTSRSPYHSSHLSSTSQSIDFDISSSHTLYLKEGGVMTEASPTSSFNEGNALGININDTSGETVTEMHCRRYPDYTGIHNENVQEGDRDCRHFQTAMSQNAILTQDTVELRDVNDKTSMKSKQSEYSSSRNGTSTFTCNENRVTISDDEILYISVHGDSRLTPTYDTEATLSASLDLGRCESIQVIVSTENSGSKALDELKFRNANIIRETINSSSSIGIDGQSVDASVYSQGFSERDVNHVMIDAFVSNEVLMSPFNNETRHQMEETLQGTHDMFVKWGLDRVHDREDMNSLIENKGLNHRHNGSITCENKRVVWDQLIVYIETSVAQILGFFSALPGVSTFSEQDRKVLIRQSYYDVWMLTNACLLRNGENYMKLPNGWYYSRVWMEEFISNDIVSCIHSFAEALNTCDLSDSEIGLLCAFHLTCPDIPGITDSSLIRKWYLHYLDVFEYTLSKTHPQTHNRCAIRVFKLLSKLHEINTMQKEIVLEFKETTQG